jgi:hypothetical protein
MMFNETPSRFNGANVIRIDMGMLTATMIVLRKSRRNRKRTQMARTPPIMAVYLTSLMLLSMNRDRSASVP